MDTGNKMANLIKLIPELKGRLSKYAVGLLEWIKKGEININNPDDVSKVRLILKVIDQTPAFDFFDETFNGCGLDNVCSIIGIVPIVSRKGQDIKLNYKVVSIQNYEDASKFFDDVSWCIVISEESFNDYTKMGIVFIFC